MKLYLLSLLALTVMLTAEPRAEYNYTDLQEQSARPPAGLTVEEVPCFVVLGFDNNPRAGSAADGGINFVVSMMKNKLNPTTEFPNPATFDGSHARISFYNNPKGLKGGQKNGALNLISAYRGALEDGHEIGSYTFDRQRNRQTPAALSADIEEWSDDLADADEWLTKPYLDEAFTDTATEWQISDELEKGTFGAGIPRDSIRGFRSSLSVYGQNNLPMIKELGLWYDCSVEDSSERPDEDGKTLRWPYTLGAGNTSSDASDGDSRSDHLSSAPTSGLWKLPNSPVFIPHDSVAEHYGFTPGLRNRIGKDKMAGLDFNIFAKKEKNGMGLSANEYFAILKYTLDQRLKGNRAPFMFGAHSQFYFDAWAESNSNATGHELRKALEDFIDYALSKSEVRIVRGLDVINWMRNPVALKNAVPTKSDYKKTKPEFSAQINGISLSLLGIPKGHMAIRLVSMNGQIITTHAGISDGNPQTVDLFETLAAGIYTVRVNSKNGTLSQKIAVH